MPLASRYKNKYREKVERQYRIVKPHATKEEIDEAFDSGSQQPELFTQQILQGPGHAAARSALADIQVNDLQTLPACHSCASSLATACVVDVQERHRDITRLETSIAELHQLFLDMSVLVEAQGELLDQIEFTVSQSVNYTGKVRTAQPHADSCWPHEAPACATQAVEELRTANKYQKKVRKKMCCVICIILVIIAIIAIPVITTSRDRARRLDVILS